MKKIINGKKYDTETAQMLGEYDNCRRSFDYKCETLYRKKTGEFFLYGEGGANTEYSKVCGDNSWCGGERIIPLTVENAKKWAETHMTGDEYEKIFGEVEE